MKLSMPGLKLSTACVVIAATLAGLPAQASEVVKLARLVVSGKRTIAESPRVPPPHQARRPAETPAQGAGGSDDAGTAPAPARGIS